jgi:UDP-N-acetylglucosamine--N-acetylmuramyl-(pentapeptide) pyrophosphoryl-undecaprenol N-acetylglucosamine transferase
MSLVENNAAILVKDVQAREELVKVALDLLHDKEKQSTLIDNILKLGKPNAAIEIAQQVLSLVK